MRASVPSLGRVGVGKSRDSREKREVGRQAGRSTSIYTVAYTKSSDLPHTDARVNRGGEKARQFDIRDTLLRVSYLCVMLVNIYVWMHIYIYMCRKHDGFHGLTSSESRL